MKKKLVNKLAAGVIVSAMALAGCMSAFAEEAETEAVTEAAKKEETEEETEAYTGDASDENTRNQDDIGEKELLVVSFGTSFNDNRKAAIGVIEDAMEAAFPEYSVRRGFTSQIIIDHVMEPLTQKFIRKLHQILMTGTVDAYRDQVQPGEYRTITSRPRDRQLLPAGQIHSSLGELITSYEHQTEIERNHILDFHVRFEEIFPFEDGNGRIGRLILFKECLRHDIMPFIIDDKRRSRYLRGIREWNEDHYELLDVVMEAQDRFEAQVELQKLRAAGQLWLPADYKED